MCKRRMLLGSFLHLTGDFVELVAKSMHSVGRSAVGVVDDGIECGCVEVWALVVNESMAGCDRI